jgi:hypothetical protein
MGRARRALRKIDDAIFEPIKEVGRKIDNEIIEPVKENPEVALGVALMFVPGLQGVGASLGSVVAPAANAAVQAGIGNAIIQGALTEAQGGNFLEGAALSGLGSVASGVIQPGISEALGGGTLGNVASSALVGGVMAEASGGDFTSGALISGIGAGINEARLAAAEEYLNSIPTEGYNPATLPTELDILDVIAAENPVFVQPDTSFTPDYSLSTGAPVIPDMGAQGIQVPTIDELVDVVNQPVDYSLPIPNVSGLGLQMPTVPNLGAMGGGQGITVPVDGGTLTEAGVIPEMFVPDLGDPNSFINQPVPDVSVNIPELPEQKPVDIETELGLLSAAKNLAPLVVGSLLANEVINQPEQRTGFDIVPIPGDWRSPEYNMAFTPSAAIDFGSPEMLAGTQWARPMDVSTLINSLNLQQPQQQFGMNEIVGSINDVPMSINDIINNLGQNTIQPFDMSQNFGELNNAPASLNSIIAGIQSQYG